MSSLAAEVADAVTTYIENATWVQTFTPVRKWRAKYKLEELASLKVTVMPGPLSEQPLTRGRSGPIRAVDIVVQKRVNPDLNSDIDPLAELVEQFVSVFRVQNLQTTGGRAFTVRNPEVVSPEKTAVSKENLESEHVFNAVVRLECVVTGSA